MKRVLIACLATLVAAAGATAGEPLPRPAALEPNVRFWLRIYSEINSAGGLIHDNRHLDIVYEALRFPRGISNRSRDRLVGKARKRHVATLRELARGKRTGLSKEEGRVLALWPEGTSNATFREAASRVRFQRGLADRFREGLIRKGIWADHIVETLEAEGVPIVSQEPGTSETQARRPDSVDLRTPSQSRAGFVFQ